MTPNTDFRCEFAAIQIAVKAEYELWVTGVTPFHIGSPGCAPELDRDGDETACAKQSHFRLMSLPSTR